MAESSVPHPLRSSMVLTKGHGTENDFIIIDDPDAELDLGAELVRLLCDRHSGVGADGVLRVVRTEFAGLNINPAGAPYFMDYRNADGSIAEMCGNGVRVFARFLRESDRIGPEALIATRGGLRAVQIHGDGSISVGMGDPEFLLDRPLVRGRNLKPQRALAALEIPNPHVVVALPTPAEVAALDLLTAPEVGPALPNGQNVEFVSEVGERHLVMRVHERGVGETRSCGTGICAVVVAMGRALGLVADGVPWVVDVPGGRCTVTWAATGVQLRGPAVLVSTLRLSEDWLERALAYDSVTMQC